MTDQCRSCGASIVWGRLSSGSYMPLDAKPVAGGNLEAVGTDDLDLLRVHLVRPEPHIPRHRSHFVSCSAL